MYNPDLARDPRVVRMPGMVERLAESGDEEILIALSENPALSEFPAEVIAKLMKSRAQQICEREDVDWSSEPFVSLLHLIPSGQLAKVAGRPDLSPEMARAIVQKIKNSAVWGALASNPAIGDAREVVEILERDGSAEVRKSLAANPAIAGHPEVVRRLANSERYVKSGLAVNPDLPSFPSDVIRALIEDVAVFFGYICGRKDLPWLDEPFAPYGIFCGSWDEHEELAKRLDLEKYPEFAQILAQHPSENVRAALASRPDLPLSLVAILEQDITTRNALASNPSIAHIADAVQRIASQRDDWMARAALAGNPAIAQFPQVVALLAKDEDENVRRSLASNPILAQFPEIARELMYDNHHVRMMLAKHPALLSFPKEVVRDLIIDGHIFFYVIARQEHLDWSHPQLAPYAILRGDLGNDRAAAQRPDLDKFPEAAQLLADHPDAQVRRLVAANPAIANLPRVVRRLLQDTEPEVLAALENNPAARQVPLDGWVEIKVIHGRRYRYLRWREGGKKRSRYLGKMD